MQYYIDVVKEGIFISNLMGEIFSLLPLRFGVCCRLLVVPLYKIIKYYILFLVC